MAERRITFHILVSLPSTLAVAKAIQLLKNAFSWQQGYGAFSIGVSSVEETTAYIRNQSEHQRQRTYREEFVAMLHKHGFEYDERMLD